MDKIRRYKGFESLHRKYVQSQKDMVCTILFTGERLENVTDVLLGYEGEEIVGILTLSHTSIEGVWINVGKRFRGYGTQLVQTALDTLSEKYECSNPSIEVVSRAMLEVARKFPSLSIKDYHEEDLF